MSKQETTARVSIADPDISSRAMGRVASLLNSGNLADGEAVREFEDAFASYCEVDHAVATANGTAAIHAALVACDVGPGDTVVTTPFSFVATANAVRFAGAEVAFADVDPETLNLDPMAVRETIEAMDGDVDAILPVHLYGLPADMDALTEIAAEHDAVLVEDAAQAHGARVDGTPVGGLGDAGTFSFYPTKNMTTGEGGMVVTDREDVATRVRQFVNHGRASADEHVSLGHNFRMTNVAGAIGSVQLDRLPAFVRRRRANAARLDEAVAETALSAPPEPPGVRHAYHQYTVRTRDRERLRAHLDEAGVDTGIYYPTPIHEQPVYADAAVDAPVAEQAAKEVLSVPVHPGLTESALERVAETIADYDGD